MRKRIVKEMNNFFVPAILLCGLASCGGLAQDPPGTDPPSTDPPSTDPPGTDPPGTDPPSTDPLGTDPPTSGPKPDCDGADADRAVCKGAGLVWIKYFRPDGDPNVQWLSAMAVSRQGVTGLVHERGVRRNDGRGTARDASYHVIRLDTEGSSIFDEDVVDFTARGSNEPIDIELDANGNFYLGGLVSITTPYLDKYDEGGDLIWAQDPAADLEADDIVDELNVRGDSITVEGTRRGRDAVITTLFRSTFSLDSGNLVDSTSFGTLPSGPVYPTSASWSGDTVYFIGGGVDTPYRIHVGLSDGNLGDLVTGFEQDLIARTDASGALYLRGSDVLGKFNSSGQQVWLQDLPGDSATLAVHEEGKYVALANGAGSTAKRTVQLQIREAAGGTIVEEHEFDVEIDAEPSSYWRPFKVDFAYDDRSVRLVGPDWVARVNLDVMIE